MRMNVTDNQTDVQMTSSPVTARLGVQTTRVVRIRTGSCGCAHWGVRLRTLTKEACAQGVGGKNFGAKLATRGV